MSTKKHSKINIKIDTSLERTDEIIINNENSKNNEVVKYDSQFEHGNLSSDAQKSRSVLLLKLKEIDNIQIDTSSLQPPDKNNENINTTATTTPMFDKRAITNENDQLEENGKTNLKQKSNIFNYNKNKKRKGVLFLNKKRKFVQNNLFVRREPFKSEHIMKSDITLKRNDSTKSLNGLSYPVPEETENKQPHPTRDFLLENQTTDNNVISKVFVEDHNDNIEEYKVVKEHKDKLDYEMAILFVSKSEKVKTIVIEGNDKSHYRITTKTQQTFAIKEEAENLKNNTNQDAFNNNCLQETQSIDKTTSTSNLEEVSNTLFSGSEVTKSIITETNNKKAESCIEVRPIKSSLETSCNKNFLSVIKTTEKTSVMSSNKKNIPKDEIDKLSLTSTANNTFFYQNECLLKNNIDKTTKNANHQLPCKAKVGLLSQFINPHILMYANKLNESHSFKQDEETQYSYSHDAYSSFKKDYISVGKSNHTERVRSDELTTSLNCDSNDSYYEKQEDLSMASLMSDNSRVADDIYALDYQGNEGIINKFKTAHGDFNKSELSPHTKNTKFKKLSDGGSDKHNLESKFMYNKITDAKFNMLDKKLNFLDNLYLEEMKQTLSNHLEGHNVSRSGIMKFNFHQTIKNNNTDTFQNVTQTDGTKIDTNSNNMFNNSFDVWNVNTNSNVMTQNTRNSAFQDCTAYRKPHSLDTQNNNNIKHELAAKPNSCSIYNQSALTQQFKRDYIPVRGKCMKIKHSDSISYKNRYLKNLREKSNCNFGKLIRGTTDNKSESTQRYQNTSKQEVKPVAKVIKQTSKLSVCISQESMDEENIPYRAVEISTSGGTSKETNETCKRSGKWRNKHEAIPEHKRAAFPRIYSEFSIGNKCQTKVYKHLFSTFNY